MRPAQAVATVIVLAWLLASPAQSKTIYVNGTTGNNAWTGLCPTWTGGTCGPKATIQAGIGVADPSDTVEVADGTYTGPGNKDLDFGGKAITVRSAKGPEDCIIDCEGDGRGFYFHSGETAESVLDGFTITHGYAVFGGGLYCLDKSSPTISNCIISENDAYSGGGLCFRWAGAPSITVSNCLITDNTAQWDGGGIYVRSCTADVADTVIANNTARWDGGGVYCYSGDMTITDSRIVGNRAEGAGADSDGGGLYIDAPIYLPEIISCVIADNVADGRGGGIVVFRGYLGIQLCTITGNYAGNGGGSAVIGGGSGQPYATYYTNCLIAANVAREKGGGVYLWESKDIGFINCTIAGNQAGWENGSVGTYGMVSATIESCIVWDNVPLTGFGGAAWTIVYSDIEVGYSGTGNIKADPLFVDPDGPDNDPLTWEDNDYHLLPGSPCIDHGHPDYGSLPVYYHPPVDLDGRARIVNGRVDMGPYECHAGDLNCDLMRTFDDIDPFVLAMSGKVAYKAQYPDCEWLNADCNCDRKVDFDDIDPFVALLTGG